MVKTYKEKVSPIKNEEIIKKEMHHQEMHRKSQERFKIKIVYNQIQEDI